MNMIVSFWLLTIVLALTLLVLSLPLGILLILGGWRMMQGKSYGLAVTASVLALLPCQPFFFLGLIFGVWSLVVLGRPRVKASFKPSAGRPAAPYEPAKA